MKGRLAALAVGLSADCDDDESDVAEILARNLPGASTLPFVGLLTHDGRWVGGFSGFKEAPELLKIVEAAEASLNASEAVRKKLAGLGERATKAADKGEWKTVMAVCREAGETTGRCPERGTLAALAKRGRDWAAAQFDAVVKAARAGGDQAEPRRILSEVKKQFAGEPESGEADAGFKALQRLSNIAMAEAGAAPPKGIREKAAKEYAGTRWAAIFEKAAAPPADPPEEEKPADGGK